MALSQFCLKARQEVEAPPEVLHADGRAKRGEAWRIVLAVANERKTPQNLRRIVTALREKAYGSSGLVEPVPGQVQVNARARHPCSRLTGEACRLRDVL